VFEHVNALRVFGPAGAGKTRALIRLLQDHVDDGDFLLGEGIIVSFTKAAAQDIARRVSDATPGRYHCTIHALCKRYYGFEGELADMRLREFFEPRGIEYRRTRGGDPEEWTASADSNQSPGAQLVSFWSLCRNRMILPEEGRRLYQPPDAIRPWWNSSMDTLWDRYVAWKKDLGLYDFTDMLEYAVAHPPRERWPFLVLDEAQDSTPLQWSVIQGFAQQCDVVYIAGDDDQAIYSWAGATPTEFLHARVAADEVLRVNHRSGEAIVMASQDFIRKNRERRDKDMIAANGGGLITSVFRDLPALSLDESTFVMARAHYLNEPLMEELTRIGFPFVDKRGSYGVAGKESQTFGRYLRLGAGKRIALDEWRRLLPAIPSKGPWLVRGAKARVKELDAEYQAETFVRLDDLTAYGATDTLVEAIRAGSHEPLARATRERIAYMKAVYDNHGAEYLEPATAGRICSVGSIHSFKGLECDHAVIHSGMPPTASREARIDPEPERRVFYVAQTRAKSRITHFEGEAFDHWRRAL